ncbi:MAG: hypothetical protein KGJ51_08675 [Acidobacteriota bacterium]|nr:hypothetical protein [Acidobacteriota bacterium]
MATATVEDRLSELDRKLDFIVDELVHLKRVRNSAEDLVADLTIVGKDAMKDAVESLGSTALRPEEILQLVKSVLIDARLLQSALQQLESAADFIQDASPIVRDLFSKAVAGCQTLDERGYFTAAAAGTRVADALIQSHSQKDWKQVEASVPQLVGFLRELTRPEVLQALEAIIHGFGRVQATMNVDKSVFELVRDVNSADARRGIAILVEFLKVVGSRSVIGPAPTQSTSTTGR